MSDITNRDKTLHELQQVYCDETQEIAKEALKAESEGADIHAWVHEQVDAHEWIIYTYSSRMVLMLSASPNYGFDEGLLSGEYKVEAQAFWAMYGDVMDDVLGLREKMAE